MKDLFGQCDQFPTVPPASDRPPERNALSATQNLTDFDIGSALSVKNVITPGFYLFD